MIKGTVFLSPPPLLWRAVFGKSDFSTDNPVKNGTGIENYIEIVLNSEGTKPASGEEYANTSSKQFCQLMEEQ